MLKINERQKNHSTLQSELSIHKAPRKVRDLVQSITQEQMVALRELGCSMARNNKGGIPTLLGFLSGGVKEEHMDSDVVDWICETN